jgi:hypothetical protein
MSRAGAPEPARMKREGPLRSPLRSGPLLVRSLTYVVTGATEPLDLPPRRLSMSVGSPPALSPSLAGFLRTGRPEGWPISLELTDA